MAVWQRGSWIWFLLAVMMYPAVALADPVAEVSCSQTAGDTMIFTIYDGPALADITISYRMLDDDALSLAVEPAGSCPEQTGAPVLFTPNVHPLSLG